MSAANDRIAPLPTLPDFDPVEFQTHTVVPLKCKEGSYHGSIINGRLLRVPCRRPHARSGFRTYHLFDVRTGEHVRDEEEPVGRDSRQGA